MITERDVVNRIAIDPSNVYVSVRELMSKPLITIFENSSLMDAIHSMQSKNIRRLVVTDDSSHKKTSRNTHGQRHIQNIGKESRPRIRLVRYCYYNRNIRKI
jgi:CBS-domain-containing membrane protein